MAGILFDNWYQRRGLGLSMLSTAHNGHPHGVRRLFLLRRRRCGLLALVVVDRGWCLSGPGPYGLTIGSAVCVVVTMVEMGQ